MESTLFTAMTSPSQMGGIDADLFLFTIFGALMIFECTKQPLYCLILVPVYLFSYIEGKKDKYFFKVIVKRIECSNTKNRKKWGCHSYESY